jgi:hypothetical protein
MQEPLTPDGLQLQYVDTPGGRGGDGGCGGRGIGRPWLSVARYGAGQTGAPEAVATVGAATAAEAAETVVVAAAAMAVAAVAATGVMAAAKAAAEAETRCWRQSAQRWCRARWRLRGSQRNTHPHRQRTEQ